jgi:hypothetical protein
MNRIEISKIFWQIGEFQICTSLFASFLLKKISSQIEDENDIKDHAE